MTRQSFGPREGRNHELRALEQIADVSHLAADIFLKRVNAIKLREERDLAELDKAASEYAHRNLGETACECVIPRTQIDRLREEFFAELDELNGTVMEMTTEVEGVQ